MSQFGHHLLLLLAIAALAIAGFRMASALGANGLERYVATTVFAAAAAVLEALALGLVDLGTDPFALPVAAILTLVGTRRLPAPTVSIGSEIGEWWRSAKPVSRGMVGTVATLLAAGIAWNLYRPEIGIDSLYYHVPEIVAWVHGGSPGSIEPIHPWFEVGNFPVTHEVLVAWGVGISSSLVWQGIATMVLLPAAAAAAWIGLRTLGVSSLLRLLGIGALLSIPVLVALVDGPTTDAPALCWLLCAAGLGVAAHDRPLMLVPTLVAAGLAIGTKTTTLPLAGLLVAVLLLRDRAGVRSHPRVMAVAGAAALVVGATWYVRSTINHGSPFWPFAAVPFGDPQPKFLTTYTSFLADPGAALEGNVGGYATLFGGGWLILAGAVLAPLWGRMRSVFAGAALTLASILLWSAAPTTGTSSYDVFSTPVSNVRYLLPPVALGVLTLALSSRAGRVPRTIVVFVLAGACAWNLFELLTGDLPVAFSKVWVVALAAIVVLVLSRLAQTAWRRWLSAARVRVAAAGALLGLIVLAGGLAFASAGYTQRYAMQDLYYDAGVVQFFEESVDASDERPIFMTPELFGMLTGDEVRRSLHLIELGTSCETIRGMNRRGWVLLRREPIYERELGYTAGDCLSRVRPTARAEGYRIYAPDKTDRPTIDSPE